MTRLLLTLMFAALASADSGVWTIQLEPKAPLKAGPAVPIGVTVKDASGAPVTGATVQIVLTMVDMDHGETKVSTRESAAGSYEGRAKFMMEGKWNIEVRAKKGGQSSSVKKQVEVGE